MHQFDCYAQSIKSLEETEDFIERLHDWWEEWVCYCDCYLGDIEESNRYIPDFEKLRNDLDPKNEFCLEINQLQKYYRRRAIFESFKSEEYVYLCPACSYPANTGKSYDCCAFCYWEDDLMVESGAHKMSGPNGMSLIENRIHIGKMVNIIAKALGKHFSTDYLAVYNQMHYYNHHLHELPQHKNRVDYRLYAKLWLYSADAQSISEHNEDFIRLAFTD